MKHIARIVWLLIVCASLTNTAQAQNYPTRAIRIIVPQAPGDPCDTFARLLGQHMGERLGQTFVADNRPGADGTIGVPVNIVNRPGGGGQIALTALTQHAGDPHYFYIASPTIITRYITALGTFQSYLNSANFLKHLHAEDKRLRSALTDLGLAKQ